MPPCATGSRVAGRREGRLSRSCEWPQRSRRRSLGRFEERHDNGLKVLEYGLPGGFRVRVGKTERDNDELRERPKAPA